MKYVKMLGLLGIAATALMVFTGVVSATTVKSGGANYTSTVTAESSNFRLHGSFISVECGNSHLEAKNESHGAGATSVLKVSKLTIVDCNYTITVKKPGKLEFHTTTTPNGQITWSGGEVSVHGSTGECVFTTSGTSIGTLTGGNSATLDIDSSAIPRTGGSFFCGSSGELTGNYTFKVPSNLTLH